MTPETLLVVVLLTGGLASSLPATGDADGGNSLAQAAVESAPRLAADWSRAADTPGDLLMDNPDSHPDLTVALTRQHVAPALQQLLQRSRRQAEVEATDVFLDRHEGDLDDPEAGSQHFFPSFAPLFQAPPPLGHSRPQILFQEPSQRPSILRAQHNPFQPLVFGAGTFKAARFQPSSPAPAPVAAPTAAGKGILGSGNFGVIRGGTFYDDADRAEASEFGTGDVYNPYYNGHGRPSFYGGASNPKPQQSKDFFANFRDFADINTPTKSSFSEFYVVYVNKNASRPDPDAEGGLATMLTAGATKPKNIIEQLKMLDRESRPEDGAQKKKKAATKTLSLGKQKLALLQQDKYNKQHGGKTKVTAATQAKDLYEPLLALS
ncbi:uncharacterized protein LOC134530425 [Bacillus rossius redtenbacheri]|uniref:uncharacterized protein LOC134530425 n=1 Tax=Bacillus rossius redtenbacheri TaxID=93214 RepID=UPI002FDD5CCD